MAYDWPTIEQQTGESANYRLLGEMMQSTATPADLQNLRRYLTRAQLDDSFWYSLGEALFVTTRGGSAGYRLWCAWSRSALGAQFDESDQVETWRRLRADTSEAVEYDSDVYEVLEVEELNDITLRTTSNPVAVAADPTRALRLIPSGPHTLRAWGEVFEAVDEFAILKLLQRGVLYQFDVLFAMRWIRVGEHPAFELLTTTLREEARLELATARRTQAEVTRADLI